MKKSKITILSLALLGMLIAPSQSLNGASAQELDPISAAKVETNWILARTAFAHETDGLIFSQTEMGTPDNHAISILEVPFNDTSEFEITFRVKMDEYVASGRNANDVWAGIGIMGKPVFVNWRNTQEDDPDILTGFGRAKDSPGLFTRFFNYSGDLRYEGSVYQENYHTVGEGSTPAEIVDTWQLFSGNASASIQTDITLKLSFDKNDKNEEFYNVYINGNNITPAGEAAFIERDVIFPEGKIYLSLVMNTQEDDFNELSRITVKSINGESMSKITNPDTSEEVSETPSNQTSGPDTTSNPPSSEGTGNQTGCFATTMAGSLTIALMMLTFVLVIYYRRQKLIKAEK